jgi:hypothetical protein
MNQDLPAFLRCLTEPTEEKISAALGGRRKQRRRGKVAAAREGEGLGFLAVFHLVGIKEERKKSRWEQRSVEALVTHRL